MIEVLTVGAQTTIQDQGRLGFLRYGVGCAGAMDAVALRCANIWLGNDENAAAIEIPSFPFKVRALADTHLAVSGADSDIRVDDIPFSPWGRLALKAGQTLHIGAPRRYSRCYLAVAGGWDVPLVLGSRSTQNRGSFGGLEGRGLSMGDRLRPISRPERSVPLPPDETWLGFVPPYLALPDAAVSQDGECTLRVLRAGEYGHFTEAAIAAFWQTPWKVTMQSNRAGYRLAGETLTFQKTVEMRSHGIVPGVVQVPPSGAPIIQLSDAHTAGGYPKIGTVIQADLWRIGQAPLGSVIRFVEVDYEQALQALEKIEHYLNALRLAVNDTWDAVSPKEQT